jgi:hypothetical protein
MQRPLQPQPRDLRPHNPEQPKPPNTKKYTLPNSERLQLLAKFIEIINNKEFCVGCMARRHPVVSLHQLSNCPHGIADYRDTEWMRWRKTLIFPKSVGICGGCGVHNQVQVFCFISQHIFMVVTQDIYSDTNNEDTKLLHYEEMGPKLCPHVNGIRVLAWLVVTDRELEACFVTSRWAPTKPINGLRTWQSWLSQREKKGNIPSNLYNIASWWIETFGMPVILS